MQHLAKWLPILLMLVLASCSDDDDKRSHTTTNQAPVSPNETQRSSDLTTLSDPQVKAFNHAARAVLQARLAQKKQQQISTANNREQLTKLQNTVTILEQKLRAEQRYGYLNTNLPNNQAETAELTINPAPPTAFHYQPASNTFAAQTTEAASVSTEPQKTAVTTSAQSPQSAQPNIEQPLRNALQSLAAIRHTLNTQYHANKPALTKRIQNAFSTNTARPQVHHQQASQLLALLDKTEAIVEQIKTDNPAGMQQLKALKQQLKLQTPATVFAEAEPTIFSLKKHRHL